MNKISYLIICIGLFSCAHSVDAQLSRGNHLFSAAIGFDAARSTSEYIGFDSDDSDRESGSFVHTALDGSYTYLLANRWGVGSTLSASWQKGNNYFLDDERTTATNLALAPFVRYYFYKSQKFFALIDYRMGIGRESTSSAKGAAQNTYYLIGSSMGFQYFMTERFAWQMQLGADSRYYSKDVALPAFGLTIGFTMALQTKNSN